MGYIAVSVSPEPEVGSLWSSWPPTQSPPLAQSSMYTRFRALATIDVDDYSPDTDYTPNDFDHSPSGDYDYTPSDYDYTPQNQAPPDLVVVTHSHHNSRNQASPPSNSKVGVIVGAALGGGILLLAALLGLLFFLRRKRKVNKARPRHDNGQLEASTATAIAAKDEGEVLVDLHGGSKMVTNDHKIPESSGSNNSSCSAQSSTQTRRGTDTFTFEELSEATYGFSNNNLIGQGGFGYVYQGVLSNGKLVAIKQLKAGSFQGEREFLAEIDIISRIHHRNLVSLIGYSIDGNQMLLVYEYMANNSLAYHLHASNTQSVLTWDKRMQIAVGSAKGFAYLHEDCNPKIIHRDIKATNILLDSSFKAKVSDFGLAKFVAEAETHVTTRVMGTFGYLAPEYASSGKLTEMSDVYSFGIVLLELISGRSPIELVDWVRPFLAEALKTGIYDELVDPKLGNSYNNVEMERMAACAEACIHPFANNRPQMIQIARVLEGIMSPNDVKVDSR